jgi:hypothetical protein
MLSERSGGDGERWTAKPHWNTVYDDIIGHSELVSRSALPVRRYDAAGLGEELGPGFTLIKTVPDVHRTRPGGCNHSRIAGFAADLLRSRGTN